MINLNLNLDPNQKVQFSSVKSLRQSVIANPFKYDGLCLYLEAGDENPAVEMCYVECYKEWEASINGGEAFEHGSVEVIVDAFISELDSLGVW